MTIVLTSLLLFRISHYYLSVSISTVKLAKSSEGEKVIYQFKNLLSNTHFIQRSLKPFVDETISIRAAYDFYSIYGQC